MICCQKGIYEVQMITPTPTLQITGCSMYLNVRMSHSRDEAPHYTRPMHWHGRWNMPPVN